jgi:predicted TIM-barrel enzyme
VFLKKLKEMGFSGVQNFPTVGLFDGVFRQNLEETGMGYLLEVEMVRLAHEMDLVTCPYVFTPEEAVAMAEAGADVLVPHMGLTTSGSIGAHTAISLEEAARRVQAMHDAAKNRRTWSTSLAIPAASPGSSAPPAWSACRRKRRSRLRSPGSSSSRCREVLPECRV